MNEKIKLLDAINGHWYQVYDENNNQTVELPSVTAIIDFGFPNKQLDFWKENTSPEEIKKKRDQALITGSKVHHVCYLLSMGEAVSSDGVTDEQIKKLPLNSGDDQLRDDELLEYLKKPFTKKEKKCTKSFLDFWETYKPRVLDTEKMVYNLKLGYAGTLDLFCELKVKGRKKLYIIDYKTANYHCKGYELQISSYLRAMREMIGLKRRCQIGLLYLGKATKKGWQLKEDIDYKESMKDFILSKKIWERNNKKVGPKFRESSEIYKL